MQIPKHSADTGLTQVFLKPGEIYLSNTPARISTVLGSCISVTMYHRRSGVGGICHAVLPNGNGAPVVNSGSANSELKYVDSVFGYLYYKIKQAGIPASQLEVKLFGGASLMTGSERCGTEKSIGSQNVRRAKAVIGKFNLKIAAMDVGGISGRKIVFFTHTGTVWVKRLNKNELMDGSEFYHSSRKERH
jgi:chemotaxis protein CheD